MTLTSGERKSVCVSDKHKRVQPSARSWSLDSEPCQAAMVQRDRATQSVREWPAAGGSVLQRASSMRDEAGQGGA
jgi:hypothetical protein